MKNIKKMSFRHINIKWKLTLWAAILMLFLFLSYNILQFFVLQSWFNNHEKEIIRNNMDEVVAYLKEIEGTRDLSQSEHYLSVLNERYQLIRVVDTNNTPLITVSDKISENWVLPSYVSSEQLIEIAPEGDTLLIYRMPITFDTVDVSIEIVRNLENFESLINLVTTLFLVTGIVAILLSFVGGRLISFQLLSPINSIIRTMKGIRENGLKERVPISDQRDEMTELSIMFNELMDGLEKSFQQQQQFIEDASHELKTPLSIIHGHLSLIKRWGKDEPEVLERSIQLSLNETNRLIQMVSELLILTRVEDATSQAMHKFESIKVRQVLEEIIENFQTVNHGFKIAAHLQISEDFVLNVRKDHLQQVMIIILDNAIKYAKNEKTMIIHAELNNNKLQIFVKDYGMGIPEHELPLVSNRFYRVEKARSRKHGGNGLGLAIAKKLLEYYGGRLEIDSDYGNWTKVTIQIPLQD